MKINFKEMTRKDKILLLTTLLKYVLSLAFPIVYLHIGYPKRYIVMVLIEIITIALITNLLCNLNTIVAYIFDGIALLILNVQCAILYYASSYLSVVMLINTDSVQDLQDKFVVYIPVAILVLFVTFLPIRKINIPKKLTLAAIGMVVLLYVACIVFKVYDYSPYKALVQLGLDYQDNKEVVKAANQPTEKLEKIFYKDSVGDYVEKDSNLTEQPNVILIFTEGLSENMITDSQGVMPNISNFQTQSINYTNYFNQSFATFMALQGQLYSGYQKYNYDKNYLVSLQSVLQDQGYNTSFINTEPKHEEFTQYVKDLNYDEVITDTDNLKGSANSIADPDAYDLLFKTAEEKNKSDQPFFITMYTFGTHLNTDSPYNKWEDGSSLTLNRNYELDLAFGEFINEFNNSDLYDNTIIVFTADHAAYVDNDYSAAYPDYVRPAVWLDTIPLNIYYKGVTPCNIDVNGRNTLDLTPTILDMLDISAENYFMGESLYAPYGTSKYDTIFNSVYDYRSTANGIISEYNRKDLKQVQIALAEYNRLKLTKR